MYATFENFLALICPLVPAALSIYSKQNIRGLGFKRAKKIGECAYDCDRDRDCARGLLCADKHKAELRAAGLDERHAYCGDDIYFAKGYNRNPAVREVCYDPNKV